MRYLLMDRILRLQRNKSILAVKSVALSEDIFVDHFIGAPVMPGALQLEALAQAATALLEYSMDFKKKALLVMVEQAKFRKIVRPGDQLQLAVEIHRLEPSMAQLEGTIHTQGNLVSEATLTFAFDAVDRFYPIKTRHLMESVYASWLEGADITD